MLRSAERRKPKLIAVKLTLMYLAPLLTYDELQTKTWFLTTLVRPKFEMLYTWTF